MNLKSPDFTNPVANIAILVGAVSDLAVQLRSHNLSWLSLAHLVFCLVFGVHRLMPLGPESLPHTW